jgi:hypothetical protein
MFVHYVYKIHLYVIMKEVFLNQLLNIVLLDLNNILLNLVQINQIMYVIDVELFLMFEYPI